MKEIFLQGICFVNFQQTETAVEIAQRKNLKDIMQILQQYNHKSPRTLPASKYPEKSVDDTTEEEFDVDAIMKDPTYNTNNNDYNTKRDRSSSSSKENHHQRPPPTRSKRNSDARRQKYKKSKKVSVLILNKFEEFKN